MRRAVEEAIEKAIKREQGSYTLYSSLLKKAKNTNTQALFRTLALQEMKHEALLKEYLKTGDMMDAKDHINSMYVDENIKIVENLNASVSTAGIEEGIQLAIKKERNAQSFYEDMIERTDSEVLKDVLWEIHMEEKQHERLLRKEYHKLFG